MCYTCNFLCNLSDSAEKEIHCKLQETRHTLQSRAATYSGFKNMLQSLVATCNVFKKSLQSLQKVELSSTASVTCRTVLKKKSVAICNLPATCLSTLLQDKLQEKFHRVTPAYSVQLTLAQKGCEISCKEGMLYSVIYLQLVSQRYCKTSCKENFAV